MIKFLATTIFALTAILAGCSSESVKSADGAPLAEQLSLDSPETCDAGFEVIVQDSLMSEFYEDIRFSLDTWGTVTGGKVAYTHWVSASTIRQAFAKCQIRLVWDDEPLNGKEGDWGWGSSHNIAGKVDAGVIGLNHLRHSGFSENHEVMRATLLHEMGHVLGLDHDSSREHKSVMWPVITVPAQLGCEDVRRVCSMWDCTPGCIGNDWVK